MTSRHEEGGSSGLKTDTVIYHGNLVTSRKSLGPSFLKDLDGFVSWPHLLGYHLAKFPVLRQRFCMDMFSGFSITQSPHSLHDYMKHTYANPHSGFSPNCESPKPCPTFWCLKIGYNPLSHLFPAKMVILRPFGEVPQPQTQPFSKPGVTIPFFTRYMKLPGPSSLITFPWL